MPIAAFMLISPSPSARPANVAGPRLSVTGAFYVESQPLAFPDVVWIDARRLLRADVEKHIRTAGVVCDETVATIGIPHFQGSCSHRALFLLCPQPDLDKPADGFEAAGLIRLLGRPCGKAAARRIAVSLPTNGAPAVNRHRG
jgi:hypothetical protein